MNVKAKMTKSEYYIGNPELKSVKLLYILMSVLLITDWIVPLYFGIHIGFDFTVTRILNVIIIIYFMFNRKALHHFLITMLEVQVTPYLILYLLVCTYTTVFRVNVNTFFLNFLDVLTFYMIYYAIRYVIGIKKAIDWTVRIAWIIAVYGLIEYVLGYSLLIRFFKTLPYNNVREVYRSGQYRIMGPCLHSIALGMLVFFLLAIICIDYEKDEIYLFKHPVLYVLLVLNVFLTGSRGPLGMVVLETFMIIAFSKGKNKKKTLGLMVIAIVSLVALEMMLLPTSIGQYVMLQITSVIDEVFGTSFAVKFGADTLWLEQSSDYREYLPRIFTVEWLNPLIGQGVNAQTGFEFDGFYVKSIDNFYVALYIRYGYPGLVTFALVMVSSAISMLISGIKTDSGLCKALSASMIVYIAELWFVDYLNTTKYMFIVMALYAAYYSINIKDKKRGKK